MAYSNDYNQITSGLENYIGAIIQSLPDTLSTREKSHLIISKLCEESVKIAQDDLYAYKPLFRTVIYILNKNNESLKNENNIQLVQERIDSNNTIISLLENLIKVIK